MNKIIGLLLFMLSGVANAGVIYLDADSASSGLNLGTTPLITSYGTISFSGEITALVDPEFTAAGASGNNFDIVGGGATLSFDFDISSFEFIFGGNIGEFSIIAADIFNNTIDSFYQPSTNTGEFAGPLTLSGAGIRSIFWNDTQGNFAPIDNITITTTSVPEPSSIILLGLGLAGLGFSRKIRAV